MTLNVYIEVLLFVIYIGMFLFVVYIEVLLFVVYIGMFLFVVYIEVLMFFVYLGLSQTTGSWSGDSKTY